MPLSQRENASGFKMQSFVVLLLWPKSFFFKLFSLTTEEIVRRHPDQYLKKSRREKGDGIKQEIKALNDSNFPIPIATATVRRWCLLSIVKFL